MTNKKAIWIDSDLAVGMKRTQREGYSDVDDGYAIWQLLNADSVALRGLSAVFGNTDIDSAFRLCGYMSQKFAGGRLPVFRGAGEAINLRTVATNPAVEAMAEALRRESLTIMAIGPATNVGLLLLCYPELASQMEEVVLVAGRRKATDAFPIGTKGSFARDLNFDLDNDAFRVMLEAGVNVTLCPFEISSKVWLKATDLDLLAHRSPAAQWLALHSRPWLQQWINQGAHGFNPFDVLASHYLLFPDDILKEQLNARLEIHPDDTLPNAGRSVFKQYLLCDDGPGFPVTYCYGVVDDYHERLLNTL